MQSTCTIQFIKNMLRIFRFNEKSTEVDKGQFQMKKKKSE